MLRTRGAVDAVVVSYDPPLSSYTVGLILRVRIKHACNGPSTIDAGAGVTSIVRANGASTATGDLVAGMVAELVYDGTFFQLVNFLGGAGTGCAVNTYITKLPYAVDTGTGGNIIAAFPPLTSITTGDAVLVKLGASHTLPGGATTFTPDALASHPVFANGGPAVLQGDAIAGDIMLLRFDGTNWFFDPYPMINANTTLNVPSQFSTPTAALTALKRKAISQG
jgi:hypothetical protein